MQNVLFQSVTGHPLLTPNTVGGFLASNMDASWNDARSALAVDVSLSFYEALGELSLLERAVAAIRAGFQVAPFSGWAADGATDEPLPPPTFHWGQGSIMSTVENWYWELGDAYVNLILQHAVGINGCSLSNLLSSSTAISLNITTPFAFPKGLLLIVDTASSSLFGAPAPGWSHSARVTAPEFDSPDTSLTLSVNGYLIGSFNPDQLSSGIVVPSSALQPPAASSSK